MSGFGMGSICSQERFDASPCDCHNQTDALPKCNSVAFSRDGLCRARRHALSPQQFVWRWQLRESAARHSEEELQFAPAGSFPVHLHFRRLIIQIDVPIFAKCTINPSMTNAAPATINQCGYCMPESISSFPESAERKVRSLPRARRSI
jgi:hypothetical protein